MSWPDPCPRASRRGARLDRRVQSTSERHRGHHPGTQFPNTLDQSPVGGHDAYRVGRPILPHHPHDLIVGRVPSPPRREHHSDGSVRPGPNIGWPAVEDDRDVFAHGGGVSVELVDESPNGSVRIVPPPVRSGADQVHAVDQPAGVSVLPRGSISLILFLLRHRCHLLTRCSFPDGRSECSIGS